MSGPRLSIIPARAVTDRALEPRDLQVLCLLGRHIDDNGWCCRSQVQMARELACGRATVQRSLARLVSAGYIEHRPKVRDSGADAAHDYRVILDQPPASAMVGATSAETTVAAPEADAGGVPTSGQGVPTHERAGGAQPRAGTNVNAPCLTPPVERSERERASAGDRDGENRKEAGAAERPTGKQEDTVADVDLFERFKRWPTFAGDSQVRIRNAWEALTHDERREAERAMEAYLEFLKSIKRSHTPAAFTYLAEKRWEALPPDKRARPVSTRIGRFTREWLALALKLIGEGRPLGALVDAVKPGSGPIHWPVDDMPDAGALSAHDLQVNSATPEGFAWGRYFAGHGLDLGLDPPGESGGRDVWLWLPSAWPPGWDAERARRELAADVERRRQERDAAVSKWQEVRERFG